MLSRRRWLLGAAALAAPLPGCYAKPPKPYPYAATPEEELRERVAARVRAFQASAPDAGVAVGIWRDGRPSVFGFGRTTYHDPHPPNADALFELGSLAETLVGVLLAEMVARKRAAFDGPAQELLPPSLKLPADGGGEITLRQLALHTSGLPAVPDLERVAGDEAALTALLAKTKLETPPGARFQPSNLGIALLGHALATREGRSIGWLCRNRIAAPLGMLSTTTFERDAAFDDNRLVEGRAARGARVAPRFDVPMLSVGAQRTSLNDLLRLLQVVLVPGQSSLGAAIFSAIDQRRPLGDGTEVVIGWRSDPARGVLWQAGSSPGFRAGLWVERQSARAIAVLAASASIDVRALLFELAREEALPSSRAIAQGGPVVQSLPPTAIRADVVIDGKLRFAGHRVESVVVSPGDALRVVLYWQCLARMPEDLQVSVVGMDESGRERLRADHYPAGGRYPTYRWRPGDVVEDELVVVVPAGYDAGRLTLWLGLTGSGRPLLPAPARDVDLAGRIRGPSVEVVRGSP